MGRAEELEAKLMGEEEIREPINKLLTERMVTCGRVDLSKMSPVEIDHAVHMLRRYRAAKFGWPLSQAA